MNLIKLARIINDNFGPPFLPDGVVSAILKDNGQSLILTIDRRDIEFDNDGEVFNGGTFVENATPAGIKELRQAETNLVQGNESILKFPLKLQAQGQILKSHIETIDGQEIRVVDEFKLTSVSAVKELEQKEKV